MGQNDTDYVDIIAECIAGTGHPIFCSEKFFNRNMILKLSKKSSIIVQVYLLSKKCAKCVFFIKFIKIRIKIGIPQLQISFKGYN